MSEPTPEMIAYAQAVTKELREQMEEAKTVAECYHQSNNLHKGLLSQVQEERDRLEKQLSQLSTVAEGLAKLVAEHKQFFEIKGCHSSSCEISAEKECSCGWTHHENRLREREQALTAYTNYLNQYKKGE